MHLNHKRLGLAACAIFATVAAEAPAAYAQTATTGAVTGVVTDTTGAALPNATVTVTSTATGAVSKVQSNDQGRFSVSLLNPGAYTVTALSDNFVSDTQSIYIALSQQTTANISMKPAGSATTINVSAEQVPLLDTQNASLITTFNQEQILDLPAPGGDVTTVAFTLPGVVVNAGGGYGNFSSNGLPGISNLFVLNGFDNQDPFLNLNNSGSSNLTLGQGELAEISVVQNGYSSQFGRAAGAIINYTTKSGTNKFHGLADYYYNGTALNANGWFANQAGIARPHAVSNEWAANIGGPIIKDKVFFFADYEGLRYVLPGASGWVNFPSPALQTYILGSVPAQAQSLYSQAFAAYQGSPSYSAAVPVTTGSGAAQDSTGLGGCGDFAAQSGGLFGATNPCINTVYNQTNNINKEYLFTARGDWVISDKQAIYGRFKLDRGSQPTSTSAINPLFSTVSIQPEYEGQLNHRYNLSPNTVNSFTFAANWYSAFFGPANNATAAAVYPDFLLPDLGVDSSGTNSAAGLYNLGVPYVFPQGRNVTQYQFVDDISSQRGRHTLKAGFNFRRDDVTDYDSQAGTVFPLVLFYGLQDYAAGQFNSTAPNYLSNQFDLGYTSIPHDSLALYNLGVYVQDEMQALPNLKLTMGVRVDRTGDPLCNNNCFSRYSGGFPQTGASADSPYNAASGGPIVSSNAHPFYGQQSANIQGRFGFNYLPEPHTEIRGGVGNFSDLYPAVFLDSSIKNFPNYNNVVVNQGGIYAAGSGAGTVRGNAAASNAALQSGFASGASLTQINNTLNAVGTPFTPPALGAYFPREFKVPEYLEYSLQIQHQFTRADAVILTYAGNVGYDGILINPYQNPASGIFDSTSGTYQQSNGPFANLPVTPADPRFSSVTSYTNANHSNYNGLQITYKRSGGGITGELSYTYSHTLDDVSNGGVGLGFGSLSVTSQLTPDLSGNNLNYSNADYDIRHNLAGDVVYTEPYKFQNPILREVAGGWVVGAKTYARTGEPFSVINPAILPGFTNLSSGTLMPDRLTAKLTDTCGSNAHGAVAGTNLANAGPCLNLAEYNTGTQTDFGNVKRNSVYGPHYVDTDLLLTKKLVQTERLTFQVGANAYNVFNHANFSAPNNSLSSQSTFGLITSTVAPPTSPYGSFQGAAITQRILQVHGRLTF